MGGRVKPGSAMITANTIHLTYGGTGYHSSSIPARFIFPGGSDTVSFWGTGGVNPGGVSNVWSEISCNDTPGDRRGIGSSGPFNLAAGASETITLAYIFAEGAGGNISSRDTLLKYADTIISHFGAVSGVVLHAAGPAPTVDVYPNPAKGFVNIGYTIAANADVVVGISDILGKDNQKYTYWNMASGHHNLTLDIKDKLSPGIYFISVNIKGQKNVRKIVVELQ